MENPKVFVNRKMENNPFYMAPVEIIVPFHGEQTSVTRLMDSIFKTVHTNRYLLTLVDDCSPNRIFIKEIDRAKIPGVRCFRQEEHKGFGAAVNLALQNPWTHPPNPPITWVAIMQSDVFAEENNWLSSMGETLNKLKGKGVKMVSPMTNNPMVESTVLTGSKGDRREDRILDEGFLPMYCVLAHRELFSRVGPLRELPYAGTEAEEYAVRMRLMGYKQAVCGTSWVNHEGGVTLRGFADNTKVQEILRKVREEFDPGPKKELLAE